VSKNSVLSAANTSQAQPAQDLRVWRMGG